MYRNAIRINAFSNSGIQFFANTASTVARGTSIALTEVGRFNSDGNFLVGTTSVLGGNPGTSTGACFYPEGILVMNRLATSPTLYVGKAGSTGILIQFSVQNTTVGYIDTNGSTTTYNTSSDYRLKNTIAPMTGALAKVARLKPCTYKWNSTGLDGEGFIAHELAEVCPDAVSGEKDAVNKDGSIKPQGIDTSFLVATLTAAIQELKAEFDAYKASHP
jgi:hypothetical protein